jgi:CheY-like chemotaxis protein
MSDPHATLGSKKYNILVVEDEPDARTTFVELLSTVDNYQVSSAADGVDALAKAEATKYDLILLDIVMPKKDGIETLTEILSDKNKYGEPVIIMLTNIGGDIAVQNALELGAHGYKLKSATDPEELIRFVAEMLEKKERGELE